MLPAQRQEFFPAIQSREAECLPGDSFVRESAAPNSELRQIMLRCEFSIHSHKGIEFFLG